jgi:hypothetical protein
MTGLAWFIIGVTIMPNSLKPPWVQIRLIVMILRNLRNKTMVMPFGGRLLTLPYFVHQLFQNWSLPSVPTHTKVRHSLVSYACVSHVIVLRTRLHNESTPPIKYFSLRQTFTTVIREEGTWHISRIGMDPFNTLFASYLYCRWYF